MVVVVVAAAAVSVSLEKNFRPERILQGTLLPPSGTGKWEISVARG